jgi:hypothetical protein
MTLVDLFFLLISVVSVLIIRQLELKLVGKAKAPSGRDVNWQPRQL